MSADARMFDVDRIGRIADIWDNNTYPLVSAACAVRLVRAREHTAIGLVCLVMVDQSGQVRERARGR